MIFMKIYNFLSKILVVFIVFSMLLTFSEDNTVNLNSNALRLLSPQGYAFFTRNPQEPQIFIYRIKNDTIEENLTKNSSTLDMFFGLSRVNRRESLEMNNVISKLTKWKDYTSLNDIKTTVQDTLKITSTDSKKIKGNFLIIKEKRIPWAWSKNLKTPKQRFKFIYLK
ncbi:SdpA family antimicrobial peptide system protein [Tenacibaculum maritimum]